MLVYTALCVYSQCAHEWERKREEDIERGRPTSLIASLGHTTPAPSHPAPHLFWISPESPEHKSSPRSCSLLIKWPASHFQDCILASVEDGYKKNVHPPWRPPSDCWASRSPSGSPCCPIAPGSSHCGKKSGNWLLPGAQHCFGKNIHWASTVCLTHAGYWGHGSVWDRCGPSL